MPTEYPPGPVEGASLTVIRLVEKHQKARDNRYLVRMHCCMNEQTIRHDSIQTRVNRKIRKCHSCANGDGPTERQRNGGKDAPFTWLWGIHPPTWEKPPSVPTGR